MRYEAAAKTHRGLVRKGNEDACAVEWTSGNGVGGEPVGVFVVADGVGGRQYGEVASSLFCEDVVPRLLRSEVLTAYAWEVDRNQRKPSLVSLMRAFADAAAVVFRHGQETPGHAGMATTGVVLVGADEGVFVAHAGDSRAYLLREGKVFRLTEDHTVAKQMVREGMMSPEDAANHPYGSALARAIGQSAHIEPDTLFVRTEPGDRFIVCTDGLHRYLRGPEMLEASERFGDRNELVDYFVAEACSRGGKDNITVVVIDALFSTPAGLLDTQPTGSGAGLNTHLGFMYDTFLFQELSQLECMRVMRIGHTQQFKAGDLIIEEGSVGDAFYVLLSDEAQIYKGAELLTTVSPGHHFGEMALIEDDAVRSADVIARAESECMVIARPDFTSLLREDPGLGNKLLVALVKNLGRTVRNLSNSVQELSDKLYGDG